MSMNDTDKFQQAIHNKKKQSFNKFSIEYALFALCLVLVFVKVFDVHISFGKSKNIKQEQVSSLPENRQIQENALALPDSGQIQIFTNRELLAPLGIVGSLNKNAFFKFYDAKENLVFTLFVRKNSSVNLKVPLGEYIVKYATGEEWYGFDKLFGFSTDTYEFTKKLLFYREGNILTGHTLELNGVINGNLPKKNITKSSF